MPKPKSTKEELMVMYMDRVRSLDQSIELHNEELHRIQSSITQFKHQREIALRDIQGLLRPRRKVVKVKTNE